MIKVRDLAVVALVVLAMSGSVYAADGILSNLNYTIYGKLHGSFDSLDDGKDSKLYLSSNSSRIGLKGENELQSGLNLVWQVESEARVDEAGTTLASRDSFVGLSSKSLGRVIFGRNDSPCKTLGRKTDLFGDQIGDTRNIFGTGSAGFDPRLDNVVMYSSPKIAGMVAAAAYKAPETIRNTDARSFGLTWTEGGLMIGTAYEMHGDMMTGTDTNKDGKADVASAEEESAVRVGASYKIGAVLVSGMYEHMMNAGGVDGADRDTVGGGAAYTIGKYTIKGQYYTAGVTEGSVNNGADMVAAGVDYNIAKNTILYVAYAQTMNDSKAKVSMSGGGHGNKVVPVEGKDGVGYSVGMMYSF